MLDSSLLDEFITGRVEPHIYAFSTNTIPNYLKVGDTYRPVSERLREWRVCYPNLEPQYDAKALISDEVYFRDFSVHQYLETDKKRIRLAAADIPQGIYYSREFFREATSADVQDAIEDIEKDYSEKTQKYQFYNVETLRPETTHYARTETFSPRPNQEAAIANFNAARANGRTNLLMYAVMRFGKSFTSMCCALEMGAKLVVVVSAKADVLSEWKRTVESHVKFEQYEFIAAKELKRNNHAITDLMAAGKRVVVFLTLQDLQGKVIKDRHREVFGQDIDLLLVDETHFGARAQKYGAVLASAYNYETDIRNIKDEDDCVDSETADKIIKTITAKITIHLSGTPYRILMSSEFKKEDIIAFYQFTDIETDKENWDKEHILGDDVKEWDNPYYGFPQMVRFAFNPNESSRNRLAELKNSGVTYAFSALFKPLSIRKTADGLHKKFKYEKEILDLLEVIDGTKEDDELFGFLGYDKIKEGKMCRHIVIVLPYCAACDALESLIKDNADRFVNLSDYEILNIAGVDVPNAHPSPKEVKNKIRECESNDKKTITLTVNRMLTGSTVPEWDTMIYLKDTASPQEYDQAIFRLQNQYIKTFTDNEGHTIKLNMKPQTLLVDFDPNRMFVMQEQKSKIYNANTDIGGNTELQRRIELELRYSPIVTVNSNKIEQVSASDIMRAVSDYRQDKGIREEASEIAVDLGILDDPIIRAAIERENEIGSGKGLALPAHQPRDGGGEEIDIPPVPSETDDKGSADGGTTDTGTGDGETQPSGGSETDGDARDREKTLKKKMQSHYMRLLLFAFVTKDRVISLADIIDKMDGAENSRIAANLGLDKTVLSQINGKINKFVLSDLDYKIQDINDLSQDTHKSPAEKAGIAIQKFGKLGDAIVITPDNICDDMVGLLPEECLTALPETGGKLLDIAGTAGEFALALHKRMTALGVPRETVENSIYTIPKSSLCYELIRKVYEMLGLNTQNIAGNFVATDLLDIKVGNEIDFDRVNDILTQNKPFEEIGLEDTPNKGEEKVKFEAIVGNPPYQENDGGAQKSARPIYNLFVDIAKNTNAPYLSLIIPTRWFAGGKGKELDSFRKEMMKDPYISELHDFLHPEEVFPDTNNRGGVCYFLRDIFSKNAGRVKFVTHNDSNSVHTYDRTLKIRDLDILVRDSKAIGILDKVVAEGASAETMSKYISPAKAFGLRTFFINDPLFRNTSAGLSKPIKCYGRGKKVGYLELKEVPSHQEWIGLWKVYVPESNNIGTELNDDNLNAFVGEPNSICTESFLVIGASLNMDGQMACNLVRYLKTKLARYLLSLAKISQHGTAKTYRFVPLQDFTDQSDIDWSKSVAEIDQQLYAKYGLTEEEITFIENTIKPME